MTYVLIVVAMLGWEGRTLSFQEFNTLEACEAAQTAASELMKKRGSVTPMVCVRK